MKGKGAVVHIFKRPKLLIRAVVIGAGQYQSRNSVAAGHFNNLAVIFGFNIIVISYLAERPQLVRSESGLVKLDASVRGSAHINSCAACTARHYAVFLAEAVAFQIVRFVGNTGVKCEFIFLRLTVISAVNINFIAVIRLVTAIIQRIPRVKRRTNLIIALVLGIDNPELLIRAVKFAEIER